MGCELGVILATSDCGDQNLVGRKELSAKWKGVVGEKGAVLVKTEILKEKGSLVCYGSHEKEATGM